MVKCSKCGTEQASGKFCGNCGGTMEAVISKEQVKNEPVTETEVVEQSTTVHMDQVTQANGTQAAASSVPSEYVNYVKQYLKRPSRIFEQKETEFQNGLISIIAFLVLFSISVYVLINKFFARLPFNEGIPFFDVFFKVFLYSGIYIGVIISVVMIINKLFGTGSSFKEIISIYGVYVNIAIIVVILSLLLIGISSFLYGALFLFVAIGLLLTTIPVYMMIILLSRSMSQLDAFFGYIIYLVAIGIATFILFSIIVDSGFGDILEEMSDLFYYL